MRLPADSDDNDISMWLRGTWFLINGTPVRWMEKDNGRILGTTASGELRQCPWQDVETMWPKTGAINIQGVGALYVQRYGAKQYRRSYCPRQIRVKVPGKWLVQRSHPNSDLLYMEGDDGRVVNAMHTPWYPETLDQAMQLMRGEVPSVALNRQLILLRPNEDETVVYYKGNAVGRLDAALNFLPDADELSMKRVTTMLLMFGGIV